MNPTLKLCVWCGELASWNSHFHAYLCSKVPKHMERISEVDGTSEDATQTDLAGEQGYDGRVEALDKCESRPKGRTESGVQGQDYLLTIRVPIMAADDAMARIMALKCVPQYWPEGLKATSNLEKFDYKAQRWGFIETLRIGK